MCASHFGTSAASEPATAFHKQREVTAVLAAHAVDICAVQDIWEADSAVRDISQARDQGFVFRGGAGYETGSEAGRKVGGGVGFFVRAGLASSTEPLQWLGQRYKQAAWLRVRPADGGGRTAKTFVASAYVRPIGCGGRTLHDVSADFSELMEDVQHWRRKGFAVLLGGHMNARVGCGGEEDIYSRAPHFGESTRNDAGVTY